MQARPTRFLPWPEAAPTHLEALIAELSARGDNRGALAHHERLPERPARYGELSLPLPEPLAHSIGALGIERLYTHQVQAIEALRGGLDTVIVTGTASGKSMCYHLPAFEKLLGAEDATALYLFPTKALAQDQLLSLTRLSSEHPELVSSVRPGVYDGDTQPSTRRKIRESANLILSNPDMLHQGILPQYSRWASFLRRLERIVHHYGGDFRYVMCSATIRNPGELAASLTGRGRKRLRSGCRAVPLLRQAFAAHRMMLGVHGLDAGAIAPTVVEVEQRADGHGVVDRLIRPAGGGHDGHVLTVQCERRAIDLANECEQDLVPLGNRRRFEVREDGFHKRSVAQ